MRTFSASLRAGILICALLFCGLAAQAQPRLTQRRINAMAAALERVQYGILQDARLRRAGEPLNAYLDRLVLPLSGESAAQYRQRIEGYLHLIARAIQETATCGTLSALEDKSDANEKIWAKAQQRWRLLPARLRKTRAAWNRQRTDAPDPKPLSVELEQTLRLALALKNDLRNARP